MTNQSSPSDLAAVCQKVIALAEKTSAFLAEQNKGFSLSSVEYKGLNNLVSFVDQKAERMVVEGCKAILPEAGFLTEEGTVSASEDSKKG
ncbi:MAG TPA: hypothetical protein PLK63_12710, partial [Catalimonadaceae bacterium]|nr:hypothetical protein [Catalimonadaceae bacterium]